MLENRSAVEAIRKSVCVIRQGVRSYSGSRAKGLSERQCFRHAQIEVRSIIMLQAPAPKFCLKTDESQDYLRNSKTFGEAEVRPTVERHDHVAGR